MPTSVKKLAKKLAHGVLGPGGYTRIAYKVRFAQKSLGIQLAKKLGLGALAGAGRVEYSAEYSAVDAGAERFYDVENAHRDLRRDIHRLEKGITARNRRALFGLEPCAAVISALEKTRCDDQSTLGWAHSVLNRYFDDLAPSANTTLDDLRRRFDALVTNEVFAAVPVQSYETRPRSGVETADLETLIKHRRSVRSFQALAVDRAGLETALHLAVHAPSACNRLPYRFILLDQRTLIDAVGGLAGGTAGWLDNIPCLIIVVGDWSYYSDRNDRHTPYIDSSFAVIQLLLKLEKDGMAGCVINWKNSRDNDQKLRSLLPLNAWEQAITIVAVGHPETAEVPMSIKKDKTAIVSWNG